MSDTEQIEDKPTDFIPTEDEIAELPNLETEKKLGKKGMRKSTVMTPERLEILRQARIKAIEVRKANSIKNGKAAEREEKKQKAAENNKKYTDNFNKRIEDEVQKRLMSMNMDDKMDKINELVEAKLQEALSKKKKPKKVVEESSDSEEEVVVRRRRPKKIVYEEEPPMPTPREPEPEPQRPPQRNLGSMFQYDPNQMHMNMLRTVNGRRSMVPRM